MMPRLYVIIFWDFTVFVQAVLAECIYPFQVFFGKTDFILAIGFDTKCNTFDYKCQCALLQLLFGGEVAYYF